MRSCDAVPDTLLQLENPDPAVRRTALRELCPCHLRRNIPAVWDRVLGLVHDEDVRVRGAILHLLADGSPLARTDEVVWAMGRLAHDPDPKLRRRARGVLAAYRATGRINVL